MPISVWHLAVLQLIAALLSTWHQVSMAHEVPNYYAHVSWYYQYGKTIGMGFSGLDQIMSVASDAAWTAHEQALDAVRERVFAATTGFMDGYWGDFLDDGAHADEGIIDVTNDKTQIPHHKHEHAATSDTGSVAKHETQDHLQAITTADTDHRSGPNIAGLKDIDKNDMFGSTNPDMTQNAQPLDAPGKFRMLIARFMPLVARPWFAPFANTTHIIVATTTTTATTTVMQATPTDTVTAAAFGPFFEYLVPGLPTATEPSRHETPGHSDVGVTKPSHNCYDELLQRP